MLGPSSTSITRRARSRSARVGDVKLTMHTEPASANSFATSATRRMFSSRSDPDTPRSELTPGRMFSPSSTKTWMCRSKSWRSSDFRKCGLAAAGHSRQPHNRTAMTLPEMALAARDLRDVGVDAGIRDDVGRGEPFGNLDDDAAARDVESVDEHETAERRHPLEQIDRHGTPRVDDHFGGVVRAHRIGARNGLHGRGVDDLFERLDLALDFLRHQLQLVALAGRQRRSAEPEDSRRELRREAGRIVGVHGDRSALDEQLIGERDAGRIAGRQRLDVRRVPALDRSHHARAPGGQEQQLVAGAERSGFDSPRKNAAMIEAIHVLNGKAKRLVRDFSCVRNGIERLEHGRARRTTSGSLRARRCCRPAAPRRG